MQDLEIENTVQQYCEDEARVFLEEQSQQENDEDAEMMLGVSNFKQKGGDKNG